MKIEMKMKIKKPSSKTYAEDLTEYLAKIAKIQIPKNDSAFLKKVEDFREKWGIPKEGFENKTNNYYWFEKPPKKILKRPRYVEQKEKEIIYSLGKEKIIKECVPEITKGIRVLKQFANFPFGSFFTDVDLFMRKNKIDDVLKQPFLGYLYYNKMNSVFFPKQIAEVSERMAVTKSRKIVDRAICLTFGPNTRQKDIRAIWKEQIEPLQEKLPDYCNKREPQG